MRETVQMLNDFLTGEGYRPTVDDDGDIRFKCEGGRYILMTREDDPQYVRLCFPNFWEIESDAERERVLKAANIINRRCKAVKVFTVDEDTWATVELFFEGAEMFRPVFERSVNAIQYGVRTFRETMRELDEEV